MKKTVGNNSGFSFAFVDLILALVLAISNASKRANYPKYALEKAVTHYKRESRLKNIKPPTIK